MDTTTVIILIVAAIASACLCFCLTASCCWCYSLCQPQQKSGSPLDYDVEKGEQSSEQSEKYHMTKLTNSRKDNGNKDIDGIHRSSQYNGINMPICMYNENKVVERADNESGTLLWTNHGQVFINHPGGDHAEILFISINSKPKDSISTIHIKNSPCQDCSKALKVYFRSCHYKPTILVGRIWRLRDEEDKQGLRELLQSGFKIEVWNKLHDRMYGQHDTTTSNYIRELRNNTYY